MVCEEMRTREEEEALDWFDRYVIVARPMRGRVQPELFGRQNLLEAPGHRIKILTFSTITRPTVRTAVRDVE